MLDVRFLKEDEISKAESLLYEVYILEQNWNFKKDNPSGIKIVDNRLVDNFSQNAFWVGAFDSENELVGVIRYIKTPFELTNYIDMPAFKGRSDALECNRLAVKKEYRIGSPILLQMLIFAAEHFERQGYNSLFGSTIFPNPGKIYLKLGSKLIDEKGFKYYEDEPNEVFLVETDLSDKQKFSYHCKLLRTIVARMAGSEVKKSAVGVAG